MIETLKIDKDEYYICNTIIENAPMYCKGRLTVKYFLSFFTFFYLFFIICNL